MECVIFKQNDCEFGYGLLWLCLKNLKEKFYVEV